MSGPRRAENQDVCIDFVGYEIIPFCISAGCMDCQIAEDFAQTEVEQTASRKKYGRFEQKIPHALEVYINELSGIQYARQKD